MDKKVLIEKYMKGILSEEERLDFDTLLATDEEFKAEVEMKEEIESRDLKRAIEEHHDQTFREMLGEFEEEIRQDAQETEEEENRKVIPISGKKKRFDRKWLAAASVIILLGIGIFYNLNRPVTTEELFLSNFEPYPNVVFPIERGSSESDVKTIAFSAYEREDYEAAIAGFDSLYSETGEAHYLFYKANALIALHRSDEAIPLLIQYSESGDQLSEKSGWYLAMAYLDNGDREMAGKVIDSLIANEIYMGNEATDLMSSPD